MAIEKEIITWLQALPEWQQQAAEAVLSREDVSPDEVQRLVNVLKSGVIRGNGQPPAKRLFNALSSDTDEVGSLKLLSVGDISGIENLNPRKPLSFGATNLFLVYGHNGSGKSGYVRLLKRICGKPDAVELRPNLFAGLPQKRACHIEYEFNSKVIACDWNVETDAAIPELTAIDIFDADASRLYISKEKESSYTPPILALFDDLVQISLLVRQQLQREKDSLLSKFPAIPSNLRMTKVALRLQGLKASDTADQLGRELYSTPDDEQKLERLEQRLKADDPASLAIKIGSRKKQIDSILARVDSALSLLSAEACQALSELKADAFQKRQIAKEGVGAVLKSLPLDGVASDTWRAMWEAARKYSQEEAYKDSSFPNVSEGALCVLCNQTIQPDSAHRLTQFERYIRSELEADAVKAEHSYSEALERLPELLSEEFIRMSCEAAGLHEADLIQQLFLFWNQVSVLVHQLKNSTSSTTSGLQAETVQFMGRLRARAAELEAQVLQYNSDASGFDRQAAANEKLELLARQWISQQAEDLCREMERLGLVAQYDHWIKQTDSTAISRKSGEFAERILTAAYIERFNNELRKLGASRIRVELVKTRTASGKALHAVKLRGAVAKSNAQLDILSDGEKRIVGLAAFLADVTGRPATSPFIFDDPISSLDQDFEEKTIDRLIELSKDRQVIIFTHRLSFFGIINDKVAPDSTCIRQEHWGAGEPSSTPIFAKKPMTSLNGLRNERLAQAEKIWKNDGAEAYYPLARSICSDFRILLERIVECELLGDVVARHRRDIMTKGKIHRLSNINAADCQLISDLMSGYSRFEHSQSFESPVEVPEPNELRSDMDKLIGWHADFSKR